MLPKTRDEAMKLAKQILLICVGSVVGASAYPLFLESNHIAPGGVTGLATILNFLFSLPIGLTSLALNVPLFIIGYRHMGRGFVLRTLLATLLFSLLIDVLKFKPVTSDPMMASIFGGVLLGIGLGLILKGSATTGGTDMMARVVHRYFPAVSVGSILFAFDGLVILLAAIFMSVEHAMYALINVYITARVIDLMLSGFGTDKCFYVISDQQDQIAARLMKELERGVTLVPALGAYTNRQAQMILCVVGQLQLATAKKIIREVDPKAFVFITDTHDTLGEGFRDLRAPD